VKNVRVAVVVSAVATAGPVAVIANADAIINPLSTVRVLSQMGGANHLAQFIYSPHWGNLSKNVRTTCF